MPASLITFLQSNQNCLKSDLFVITLPTGTQMFLSEGPQNITVQSGIGGWGGTTTTFQSTLFGRWFRGSITSEATFSLNANTMALTCVVQPSIAYPNTTIGLLNAALQGLFDAATVTVLTAYMPLGNYGNVSAGLETKFTGTITRITDINRVKVEFECSDPMYLLNMKVPTRLFQANCPWSFCDSNCTLSAANYTAAFTAASGSTNYTLIPATAFMEPVGYYTQGVVRCTSGVNSGLSQSVKLHDSYGNLELAAPWIMPVAIGDSFTVIKGCNKTMSACESVNNLINFGGTPFTPPATDAV